MTIHELLKQTFEPRQTMTIAQAIEALKSGIPNQRRIDIEPAVRVQQNRTEIEWTVSVFTPRTRWTTDLHQQAGAELGNVVQALILEAGPASTATSTIGVDELDGQLAEVGSLRI